MVIPLSGLGVPVTLPNHINDREYRKFIEVDGEPAVRISGTNFSGTFSVSGLKNGGKVTEVSIDELGWTLLPATALSNRNAMAIQNYSGQDIKLNYNNTEPGYVGVILKDGNERFYDISDNIQIWAKSSSSSCVIIVEELS